MSNSKRENLNSIISVVSLLVAIVAIVISIRSNNISQKNLEIVQKPLMRAVMNFSLGNELSDEDETIVSIYNDGPVLTDFDIEPTRFLLINNSVLIPTDLQPEMWSRSLTGETQGLITTLDNIGIYDFMRRSGLEESDYDLREKGEEPFWEFTEFNILLKIKYSDVFHEENEVYLLLSQTELRGKYIESNDAKLLLNIIKSNTKKLNQEAIDFRGASLRRLIVDIKEDQKDFIMLDEKVFNRLPFKYSDESN